MNPRTAALIGRPYLEGGDSPATGFDCWRLVLWARRHVYGLDTPHTLEGVDLASNDGRMFGLEASRALPGWTEVPFAEGLEADVVLLSTRADGRPHHCGLVVEARTAWVLHAYAKLGTGVGQVYCTGLPALRRTFSTVTVHTWRS